MRHDEWIATCILSFCAILSVWFVYRCKQHRSSMRENVRPIYCVHVTPCTSREASLEAARLMTEKRVQNWIWRQERARAWSWGDEEMGSQPTYGTATLCREE